LPGTSSTPHAEYERRLTAWRDRIAALDRRHLRMSNGRLLIAALLALALWFTVIHARISPWWPVGAGVAFAALAILHARLLERIERARGAERVYLRGLERLNGRWAGTGRDGAHFIGDHPYARDLDLFGRASLFELLNTARTEAGEATLAAWLSAGAPIDDVLARQQAVDELSRNVDLREDLAVLAAETAISRTGALVAWALATSIGFKRGVALTLAACGAIAVVLAVLAFEEQVAVRWLILWLLAEGAIAIAWKRRFQQVLAGIEAPDRDLGLLAGLLARIEVERFSSPRLAALQASLLTHGVPPSKRIAQLRQMVSWLDSTRNQMFAPFAYALMLPQLLAIAIDRWHGEYGHAVDDWLRVVGELEALSSMATYAYEHPRDPFPTLVDKGPLFEADALAHPLIPEVSAVPNDVRLGGDHPHVIVVSGSNMSGKSTLLRSVGVNVVLALAGAPVRAAASRLSPLVLGATLKVEDSLEAGRSRFYAEILRIRTIVDAARGPVPLLFLLDEILHGTNSYDRRIGAEAIVRALAEGGAIGLVTTHDLALTELPSRLSAPAVNMHFEDRLESGRMVFDYRMRPGVVEHSNALALMRAIGLDV
jgi:MutS domain V